MKQRAIKRCVKRTQAKLRRNTYKGRKLKVSFDADGVVFAPTVTCRLHVRNRDILYGLDSNGSSSWGHMHWLGCPRCAVAVSYAK